MKANTTKSLPKTRTWMLAQSRRWHTWGGLFAALFLIVVGLSGVMLNYKQPLFSALSLERPDDRPPQTVPERSAKDPAAIELSTAQDLSLLPLTFSDALGIARQRWGEVRLERIELKSENGQILYKIKREKGEELWVNAVTGSNFTKPHYAKVMKGGAYEAASLRTDWGKVLLDLHTGKIGGTIGKAIMSLAAVLLVFLSFSGVYMWVKPLMIRRARERVPAASPQGTNAASPIAAAAREVVLP